VIYCCYLSNEQQVSIQNKDFWCTIFIQSNYCCFMKTKLIKIVFSDVTSCSMWDAYPHFSGTSVSVLRVRKGSWAEKQWYRYRKRDGQIRALSFTSEYISLKEWPAWSTVIYCAFSFLTNHVADQCFEWSSLFGSLSHLDGHLASYNWIASDIILN
jgi:hypothetical protein